MLAIEPLRVGRTYMFQPEVMMRTVPPLDTPWGDEEAFYAAIDSGDWGSAWTLILQEKREDEQYHAIMTSLDLFGWLKTSTLRVNTAGRASVHGDGHHRLAAALDLGVALVPYTVHLQGGYRDISPDSGQEHPEGWDIDLTDAQRLELMGEL